MESSCKAKRQYNEIAMSRGTIAAGVVGVVALLLAARRLLPNNGPIVATEDGQLQGRIAYSRDREKYLEFLAIPYAEPPVDELRFEPPEPLRKPWKGVKQATSYPPHCLQYDGLMAGRTMGKEDCLHLNVFTRDLSPKKRTPVLVYIHGGGFMGGASSMYRPFYFMDENVVLVTINYRLGPLGFLTSGDEQVRGNMGLKDQNLALKWVQRNIAKFGGDPSQVTLFGESAGAASVHYHILSPASQGLFHRALAQSGVALSPWSFKRNAKETTMEYVKKLGCPTENTTEMVSCLKKLDGTELVKHQSSSITPLNDFLIFTPSLETVVREDTFLAQHPQDILKSGNFQKVPFMLGVTSGEGGLRSARFEAMPELIPEIDRSWEKHAPNALTYPDLSGKDDILKEMRQIYFGDKTFTDNVHQFRMNFTKINSDCMFFEPTHTAALLHTKHGAPTYLYFYTYDSKEMPNVYSLIRALRQDDWILTELKVLWTSVVDLIKKNYLGGEGPHDYGVTHANDLLQLWDLDGISSYLMKEDYDFSRNFVKTVVSFAKNEKPLKFKEVEWPPINSGDLIPKYMLLDKKPELVDEPFAEQMPFWESVRKRINAK